MEKRMKDYALLATKVDYREDGNFYWVSPPHRHVRLGEMAGYFRSGYRIIRFNKADHRASVLAFFMAHGRLPIGVVDHINGNRADNRIENLRECSIAENNQNLSCLPKGESKTSRFIGVCWHKKRKVWRASIKNKGKKVELGEFKNEEDAFEAYLAAKRKFHTFNPVPRDVDEAYRSIHGEDRSTHDVDRIV